MLLEMFVSNRFSIAGLMENASFVELLKVSMVKKSEKV